MPTSVCQSPIRIGVVESKLQSHEVIEPGNQAQSGGLKARALDLPSSRSESKWGEHHPVYGNREPDQGDGQPQRLII